MRRAALFLALATYSSASYARAVKRLHFTGTGIVQSSSTTDRKGSVPAVGSAISLKGVLFIDGLMDSHYSESFALSVNPTSQFIGFGTFIGQSSIRRFPVYGSSISYDFNFQDGSLKNFLFRSNGNPSLSYFDQDVLLTENIFDFSYEAHYISSKYAGIWTIENQFLAIPEPNTWAMLVMALGLVGCGVRYRRLAGPISA